MSIDSTAAYARECAVGPEYWCMSFETAQDCGAINHCTDTVWSNNNKFGLVDSSTTNEWCQKVLENIQNAYERLTDNEVGTFS